MRLLCRLVICVLPFPLAALVLLKAPGGPVWSVVFSCLAFLIWRLLSLWQGVAGPRIGSPLGLLLGLGIGIILTVCAVIAMGVVGGYPVAFHPVSSDMLLVKLASQVRPACIEETFTRAGTVHFLASFFGPGWGYLGGSVPFALMHFWNPWFTYKHVFCITSAGLMLSAMYLEHGLLAAIGVHFAWNVLSWFLIVTLHWQHLGGTPALEGAWTTTIILLIATVVIVMVSRRGRLAQQRQCALYAQDVSAAEKVGAPIETRDTATPINPVD